MTIATRYCLQDPVRGWIRLSQGDFDRYGFKGAAMPEFAGKEIIVAVAEVELDGQKIVRIESVRRVVWRFGEDGRLDQHARAKSIAKKLNEDVKREEFKFGDADMEAFRRAFRMQ